MTVRVSEENPNTVAYWDRRYRDDAEAMWRIWTTHDLPERIAEEIPHRASVLDVGCGAGIVPARITKLRSDICWSGCDFSPEAIRYCATHPLMEFAELFVADAEDIPRPAGSYTVCLCTEVLEHVERPPAVLAELIRVARHKVIISVPNGSQIPSPEHVWEFNSVSLIELLPAGYRISLRPVRGARNLMGVICK